jgi:eukaryotic-like serine/threonine-protein kinase
MAQSDTLVSRDQGPLVPLSALPELAAFTPAVPAAETTPSYSGDLAVASFMRTLLRLHAEKASGMLVVRDATRRKDVYLEEGHPVYVTSSIGKERLGEFLMARGQVTAAQLCEALTRAQAQQQPLGGALVALGFLDQPGLFEALRGQQLARLLDLCGWEHGSYAFHEGARFVGERLDLRLDSLELWVHAARSLPERLILRRLGDVLHQVVVSFDQKIVELCRAYLNSDERVALSAFDGERSAVQVVTAESGNLPRRRAVLTVLCLFWELGGLRFAMSCSRVPPA